MAVPTLEQVLADEREAANILRREGYVQEADNRLRLLTRVATAAEDYLRFLPEPEAMLRAKKSRAWLRRQFAVWSAGGHAKIDHGVRYYRVLILPVHAPASIAREAGRQGVRPSREAAADAVDAQLHRGRRRTG